MSTPDSRAAAIAELNDQLRMYVDSLTPEQALNAADRTLCNLAELLNNPHIGFTTLRANTYERAYILRVLLHRVAKATPIVADDSADPGLEDLFRKRATQLAEILGGQVLDGPTDGGTE